VTATEFKNSLSGSVPPTGSDLLKALWHDARGDWHTAHDLAQDIHTTEGSWIHAYLHRKEGDYSNARYWYQRANQVMPAVSLEQEWENLVSYFLSH
jgi:hypothetical protein